eukprot:56716-Eustigmatos_ZCMA.PRE.2
MARAAPSALRCRATDNIQAYRAYISFPQRVESCTPSFLVTIMLLECVRSFEAAPQDVFEMIHALEIQTWIRGDGS